VEWGPFLSRRPVREYHGHGGDILDLSWSASGFILTASMDCTVRLWHLTQPDCLKSFRHSDFVTCVQAHPTDAHRFVSGG
jgi:WD40 repeat protein